MELYLRVQTLLILSVKITKLPSRVSYISLNGYLLCLFLTTANTVILFFSQPDRQKNGISSKDDVFSNINRHFYIFLL